MKKGLFVLLLALCMLFMSAAVAETAGSADQTELAVVQIGTATLTLPSGFSYNEETTSQLHSERASEIISCTDSEWNSILLLCYPEVTGRKDGWIATVTIRTLLDRGYNTIRTAGECAALIRIDENGLADAYIIKRYEIITITVRCETPEASMETLNWVLDHAVIPETPLH